MFIASKKEWCHSQNLYFRYKQAAIRVGSLSISFLWLNEETQEEEDTRYVDSQLVKFRLPNFEVTLCEVETSSFKNSHSLIIICLSKLPPLYQYNKYSFLLICSNHLGTSL